MEPGARAKTRARESGFPSPQPFRALGPQPVAHQGQVLLIALQRSHPSVLCGRNERALFGNVVQRTKLLQVVA